MSLDFLLIHFTCVYFPDAIKHMINGSKLNRAISYTVN